MPEFLDNHRARIRRLRHAIELAIANMHECPSRKLHHGAKQFLINELRKDKEIARKNRETIGA